MVKNITLTVSDDDLAESLKDCRVGEEKTLTFTVGDARPGKLSGDVTSVEGYGEEANEEDGESEENYDADEDAPKGHSMGAMKKRMPKAIIMIGAGK